MDTVKLSIVTSNNPQALPLEKNFDKSITISKLKDRLYMLTGIDPQFQHLKLLTKIGSDPVAELVAVDSKLDDYNVKDLLILYVHDADPNQTVLQIQTEPVDLPQMTSEEYQKRDDNFLKWREQNKHLFKPQKPDFTIGSNCILKDGRQGIIRYVGIDSLFHPLGELKGKSGFWVGVEFSNPVGKNNGSLENEQYFKCDEKHGSFVRPKNVTIVETSKSSQDVDEL